MKDVILNRFSKIEEFAELDLIEQEKIVTAFEVGHYSHREQTWEVAFNGKINILKHKVTNIRGEKDDLNLNRYGDFHLRQWFSRILDKSNLEDINFIPLSSGYMKRLFLILIAILSISCSVEQRIKDYSYTDEWYYICSERYQVYKTKSGSKYIIRLNKRETRFKRQYIKTP